jgi:hypothetical protein
LKVGISTWLKTRDATPLGDHGYAILCAALDSARLDNLKDAGPANLGLLEALTADLDQLIRMPRA